MMNPKVRLGSVGLAAAALAALACSACGGSSPPAQTGGAPSPSNGPANELGPSSPPPPAEPAPTADSAAGLRAFDAGNYEEARKDFDAATKKNPNDYESLHNLGMACEKLGDAKGAEAAYKAALAVNPGLESAAAELAALYIDAGRADDAAQVAQAGLAKHPESGGLHENLGLALALKGDQDGATKQFSEAIRITPTDPSLHLAFAHWLNVWKVRGAAAHLDAARDLARDNYAMLASIGFEYRMAGELEACVKLFDRAIAMKDGGEVRTERALCRLALKDDKGALADLQAAVQTEPSYPTAHYYLGGRLAMTKHFKDAAAEYAKYLELAPSGSLAKPAADRMKAAQEAAKKK